MAQPIPFSNQQASGQEQLAGAMPLALNVVTDQAGAVSRRPGIRAYSEAPDTVLSSAGVDGMFCTDDGVLLAVTASPSRRLYRIAGGAALQISDGLTGAERPVFAQTEMLVCIAGGWDVLKYERATGVAANLGGAPPKASHIIAHAQRLLGNDVSIDRTKIKYSSTAGGDTSYAGHEVWTGVTPSGYITPEGRPDNVVAIHENTNDVFAFGTGTMQIFGPDATNVYIPAATREFGCAAPYSIVKVDQSFAWLDDKRRFAISDGRGYEIISAPIKASLDAISDPSDCFGYRVVTGPLDMVVWTFPSDGRTFAYQMGVGWGQWSGANRGLFSVQSHHYRNDTNTHVVGTTDGYVAELSRSALTDLGQPIEAHVETGYINRGTDRWKHCQCVYLTLRRGHVQGSGSPVAWLSYRDRPGSWSSRIPVRLGPSGDTEPVLEFRSLGTYRRRQWRFEFTGTEDLTLVSASEEFEVEN